MRLSLILILIATNLYAGPLAWFKGDKEEVVQDLVKEEPKQPQIYHKALWVSGKEERVFYIYRFSIKDDVPDLIQVGILDEKEMVIKTVENLKITGEYKYYGDGKKNEYLETNFPNLTPLEIYKVSP